MKIMVITSCSLNNPNKGTPLRIKNIVKQLSKCHEVTVCAKGCEPGVGSDFIEWPNKGGGINRLIFFLRYLKKEKIRLIFTATETSIKLLVFLKLLCKVRIVIDLHGLYFEELYYFNRIGKIRKIYMEIASKFYLFFYDQIFVVSDSLKDYYKKINKNIAVIYGGVDLSVIKRKQKWRHGGEVLSVGYMGNAKTYQGLEYLLEALKKFNKNNETHLELNLVLSGDASHVASVLRGYNLNKWAVIHSNVDHKRVSGIINKSDILVIPRPSIKMTEYAYPSKLPEYLGTGVPIIVTDVGPVARLLKGSKCCFLISSDNIADGIYEQLLAYSNMKLTERKKMGQKSISFVENNLTWDVLGKQINEIITSKDL